MNDMLVNNIQLDDSEILNNITISSIDFDEIYGGWLVTLQVITNSGTASISIP